MGPPSLNGGNGDLAVPAHHPQGASMGPPSLNGGNGAIWEAACYNASWRPLRAATQRQRRSPLPRIALGVKSQALSLLGGCERLPAKGPGPDRSQPLVGLFTCQGPTTS